MTHTIFTLLVFASGIVLGVIIAVAVQGKLDEKRIEKALDTIGIRRKEFLKLDAMVRSCQQAIATNTNRLGYLEQRKR